jgi:hypothetical protein
LFRGGREDRLRCHFDLQKAVELLGVDDPILLDVDAFEHSHEFIRVDDELGLNKELLEISDDEFIASDAVDQAETGCEVWLSSKSPFDWVQCKC